MRERGRSAASPADARRTTRVLVVTLALFGVVVSLGGCGGGGGESATNGLRAVLRTRFSPAVADDALRDVSLAGRDRSQWQARFRSIPEVSGAELKMGITDASRGSDKTTNFVLSQTCKAVIGSLNHKWTFTRQADGSFAPKLDGRYDANAMLKAELARYLGAGAAQVPVVTDVYETLVGRDYRVQDLSPDGISLWVRLWSLKQRACKTE